MKNRSSPEVSSTALRRAEWSIAILLTAVAIWQRILAAMSAGGLWRDEVNTVGLITLPKLSDVWKNLQYESFPILWLLIVRAFANLFGPMNDAAFRVLGFSIGIGLVSILWFFVRSLRQSYPLLSLALFALSPSVIIWGDSLRAYGLGIVLALLTGALLWRFVQNPDGLRFVTATLAAIASVQVLFFDSTILMAFCAGGITVCAIRRAWKTAALVLAIGGLAAASLVPYARDITDKQDWSGLVEVADYDLLQFFFRINDTISPAGAWALFVWLGLFVISVFAGARIFRLRRINGSSEHQFAVIVYSYVALIFGTVGMFLFLKVLGYRTAPWYYLPLLAVVSVCIDVLFSCQIKTKNARVARLIGVIAIATATLFSGGAARMRLTNVDLVATRLRALALPKDLVLVSRWVNAISFSRYYRGQAPWITVPRIDDHRFHRYDLLKQEMLNTDQTAPVRPAMEAAERALRAGDRVFIVGELLFPRVGERPRVLPAAPLPDQGWSESPYYRQWALLLGDFLRQHALSITAVPVAHRDDVSDFENLRLSVASGWRP